MVNIQLPADSQARTKVLTMMAGTDYLTVAEGAVRSGKTVFVLAMFCMYCIRSKGVSFLLSGRTVKTIEKNCILDEYGILALIPGAQYRKVGEGRAVVFSVVQDGVKVTKTISIYGASTIKDYQALRGATFAGWMADEINMHDKEFVSEALRRTAVSPDRRHYWTLNPDNPRHWVYTDYLDRYDAMTMEEREELGGYSYYHFTPKDNPVMSEKMYRSLCAQFPDGYLRDRYILGLRVVAEGLIYPNLTKEHFRKFTQDELKNTRVNYCAIDYGADHPTVMLFGGFYGGLKPNHNDFRIVAEYFDKASGKTTYDYYLGFMDTCQKHGLDPKRIQIAIDPAALTLRNEFLKHGLTPIKAKNDVLPGIAFVRAAISKNQITIDESLGDILTEAHGYIWDPKASERGEEKPIKINDDRMDALRYLLYTFCRFLMK